MKEHILLCKYALTRKLIIIDAAAATTTTLCLLLSSPLPPSPLPRTFPSPKTEPCKSTPRFTHTIRVNGKVLFAKRRLLRDQRAAIDDETAPFLTSQLVNYRIARQRTPCRRADSICCYLQQTASRRVRFERLQ